MCTDAEKIERKKEIVVDVVLLAVFVFAITEVATLLTILMDIENTGSANVTPNSQENRLFRCAKYGDTVKLKELLKRRVDVDCIPDAELRCQGYECIKYNSQYYNHIP